MKLSISIYLIISLFISNTITYDSKLVIHGVFDDNDIGNDLSLGNNGEINRLHYKEVEFYAESGVDLYGIVNRMILSKLFKICSGLEVITIDFMEGDVHFYDPNDEHGLYLEAVIDFISHSKSRQTIKKIFLKNVSQNLYFFKGHIEKLKFSLPKLEHLEYEIYNESIFSMDEAKNYGKTVNVNVVFDINKKKEKENRRNDD